MATPLFVGSSTPAAENDSGTTTLRPSPTAPKPRIAQIGAGASATSVIPATPTSPPIATGGTGPNLLTWPVGERPADQLAGEVRGEAERRDAGRRVQHVLQVLGGEV